MYLTVKPQVHEQYDGWFGEQVLLTGESSLTSPDFNTHHEQAFGAGGVGILDDGEHLRFTGVTLASRTVYGIRFSPDAPLVDLQIWVSVDGTTWFVQETIAYVAAGIYTFRRDLYFPWIRWVFENKDVPDCEYLWFSIRNMPFPNGVT